MIKSVYFGCRIIELTNRQEQELKRIYEELLLIKLGLSRNFPRDVLYSRKSALGVRIMMPSTIINMLKAKLYIGNKRKGGIVKEAIELQEEYICVELGREISISYDPKERYWEKLWIDKVSDMFSTRGIKIHQNNESIHKITGNGTVMDLAVKYVEI